MFSVAPSHYDTRARKDTVTPPPPPLARSNVRQMGFFGNHHPPLTPPHCTTPPSLERKTEGLARPTTRRTRGTEERDEGGGRPLCWSPKQVRCFFNLCSFKYLFQHRKTGRRNEEVSPPHCVSVGSSAQRDGEGNLSVVSVEFLVQRRGGNPSPMCSVGSFFNMAEGEKSSLSYLCGLWCDREGNLSVVSAWVFQHVGGERSSPSYTNSYLPYLDSCKPRNAQRTSRRMAVQTLCLGCLFRLRNFGFFWRLSNPAYLHVFATYLLTTTWRPYDMLRFLLTLNTNLLSRK